MSRQAKHLGVQLPLSLLTFDLATQFPFFSLPAHPPRPFFFFIVSCSLSFLTSITHNCLYSSLFLLNNIRYTGRRRRRRAPATGQHTPLPSWRRVRASTCRPNRPDVCPLPWRDFRFVSIFLHLRLIAIDINYDNIRFYLNWKGIEKKTLSFCGGAGTVAVINGSRSAAMRPSSLKIKLYERPDQVKKKVPHYISRCVGQVDCGL